MEENKKPPVTLREVVVNKFIGAFFGLYMVYMWMGTDGAKTDIVAAFGVRFFTITKAVILMASMVSAIGGGRKLFLMLLKLRRTIRFVDDEEIIVQPVKEEK